MKFQARIVPSVTPPPTLPSDPPPFKILLPSNHVSLLQGLRRRRLQRRGLQRRGLFSRGLFSRGLQRRGLQRRGLCTQYARYTI